ncbi:MAG TPA: hypothetical protein P5316_21830, partial [Phycisphaerae bacterium]|nr:hypothetical protein [Phycisphaerae bacterium]
ELLEELEIENGFVQEIEGVESPSAYLGVLGMTGLTAWVGIREIGKPDPSRPEMKPRCDGLVALADAVVALCSNIAMEKKKRIVMNPKWFDPSDPANPESEV